MNDLGLIAVTTEELLEEVLKRQDAKGITFLYALSTDDGEGWFIEHNFDCEQLADLCDLLLEDPSWEFEDEWDDEDLEDWQKP